MARPIGARVIQACELVEQLGPVGSRAVWLRMYDVGQEKAFKYLDRAASYGLLSVEKAGRYSVFTIIPGWRERAKVFHKTNGQAQRAQPRHRPQPQLLEAVWR